MAKKPGKNEALLRNSDKSLPLLDVHDLTVEFATRRGIVRAVQHVNISVAKGESLAIVGESGSGKSVTSYAVMRILDRAGRIAEGSVMFSGLDLRAAPENEMRDLRGREMSMIFQSPRLALNPIRKVGRQIEDVLLQHAQVDSDAVSEKAIEVLEQVRIADEPTTGLDVTTQKAVMDLTVELTRERGMSMILITHDLGLAAAYCDRVVVMEKGHVVETAKAKTIFKAPAHRYTRKLMRATPRPGVTLRDLLPEEDAKAAKPVGNAVKASGKGNGHAAPPLLLVEGLVKEYPRNGAGGSLKKLFGPKPAVKPDSFKAVDGISFSVARGESVGLVGESGCGKSTTSMMVMRLIDKTSGLIQFDGEDIGAIPARKFATLPLRKRIQMVFQDPTDSLNPRYTAARAIADPILRLGNGERSNVRARCEELARQVGLPVDLLDRFPHQLSGGQKARVGIARAIALKPDLIILDEPTAALDVSVQAVVLNLLQDLKDSLGMSYLFVSHDLNVVRLLCDRVIVMQTGKIVEQGPTERVLVVPEAQYTRDLLTAIPHPPL
jgi:peptide/nickel transport system ATP-binding protein